MTTQQAQALVNARNEANKVLSAWGVTDPANLPKAAYKLWKIKQDAAVALYNKLK